MWSYRTFDWLDWQEVSEHIPFTDVTFTDSLMDGGTFTGSVPAQFPGLSPDVRNHLGRWVTVPCRGGQPQGAYVWVRATCPLDSLTYSVQAVRVDALFKDRRVTRDLVFTDKDILDVVRDLFREGMNNGTLHTDTPLPPMLGVPVESLSWLTFDTATYGQTISRTKVVNGQDDDGYRAKGRKPILDAVKDLSDNAYPFEYALRYQLDPVSLKPVVLVKFGVPKVGTPSYNPGIVFEYPGGNITSGSYGADAAEAYSRVDVVGGETAGVAVVGVGSSTALTGAGWPFRMTSQSEGQVADQANLTAKAAAEVAKSARIHDSYSLELNGQKEPVFGSYSIGDHATIRIRRANSTVIDQRVVRIVGWSVKVDDGLSETVTPTLAEVA